MKPLKEPSSLQWAIILLVCGAVLVGISLLMPGASVQKKWRKGPGTPIAWIGWPVFALGAGWAGYELWKRAGRKP